MANALPSANPGGYWLASTPASTPARVWPQWLQGIYGHGAQEQNLLLNAPPVWPQGAPDNSPSNYPYWSDFASAKPQPQPLNQQTALMTDFMHRFGVDPNAVQPHQVTPEMQDFVRQRFYGPNRLTGEGQ